MCICIYNYIMGLIQQIKPQWDMQNRSPISTWSRSFEKMIPRGSHGQHKDPHPHLPIGIPKPSFLLHWLGELPEFMVIRIVTGAFEHYLLVLNAQNGWEWGNGMTIYR